MSEHPSTVEEAVERLIEELPEESKEQLRRMEKDDLIRTHFALGMWIRNHYGLWHGNTTLKEDAGADHADSVSMIIIERLWERLRE